MWALTSKNRQLALTQMQQFKNDNETVIALIHVCIAEGLDTRRRMVGALTRLGFKHSHVAIMLEKGCRSKMWRLDSGDRYSVID